MARIAAEQALLQFSSNDITMVSSMYTSAFPKSLSGMVTDSSFESEKGTSSNSKRVFSIDLDSGSKNRLWFQCGF